VRWCRASSTCMCSSHRGVASWAKSATTWIMSLHFAGKNNIDGFNLALPLWFSVHTNVTHCTKNSGRSRKYCFKHAWANSNVTILTVTSRHFLIVGTIYCNSQHCTYLHIQEEDITSNKIHGSAFKTNFQYLLFF